MPTGSLSSPAGFHHCPHCRRPGVSNHLYCCGNCWNMLPGPARVAILQTIRLNPLHPDRRAAFTAARDAYAAAVDARRAAIENRKTDTDD